MWKKLSILLVGKFHEFSFGKTRFLIGFYLHTLWAFAVSFRNGGSTIRLKFFSFSFEAVFSALEEIFITCSSLISLRAVLWMPSLASALEPNLIFLTATTVSGRM